MRRITRLSLLLLAMVALGCGGHAAPPAAPAPAPGSGATQSASLYRRLGGYDALAAVTDAFIGRMINDPQLGSFFAQLSTPEKQRIRQMVVDQLCTVTGGPCLYVGKDMKQVHQALGITNADWTVAVRLLVATLNQFKVPAKEQGELLAIVSSLKDDIVTP